MSKKKRAKKRAKNIEEAIRLAWGSLESHLKWTHNKIKKRERRVCGDNLFHQNCIREYARSIALLSELY